MSNQIELGEDFSDFQYTKPKDIEYVVGYEEEFPIHAAEYAWNGNIRVWGPGNEVVFDLIEEMPPEEIPDDFVENFRLHKMTRRVVKIEEDKPFFEYKIHPLSTTQVQELARLKKEENEKNLEYVKQHFSELDPDKYVLGYEEAYPIYSVSGKKGEIWVTGPGGGNFNLSKTMLQGHVIPDDFVENPDKYRVVAHLVQAQGIMQHWKHRIELR